MARVQLFHRLSGRGVPFYRSNDRNRTIEHVPIPRLYAKLFVLPTDAADRDYPDTLRDSWAPEALLDTGAPLTVFPFPIWQPFADAIQWLDQPPPPPTGRHLTVLGGDFSYRLGRLRFGVIDEHESWLPAVASPALFLDDHLRAPKRAILGLRTHLLDSRLLRCAGSSDEKIGQVWTLEDS